MDDDALGVAATESLITHLSVAEHRRAAEALYRTLVASGIATH